MKHLAAFLFTYILAPALLCAATLQWDPSPASGVPVASYLVQAAPVGNPTTATWSTFGTTTGTTLLITNNVYQMFRVLGVSGAGVQSDPSNVTTNHLAKPGAPGNAIISAVIESAPAPGGPFQVETNVAIEVVMQDSRFYRSRVTIAAR